MSKWSSPQILCQYCNQKIFIIFRRKNTKIFKCGCSEYPGIYNIIYLKRDQLSKKSSDLIRKDKTVDALFTLLNLRKSLEIPIRAILLLGIKINFQNYIKILSLFGLNDLWVSYLKKRRHMESFKVSSDLVKGIGRGSVFLDFGCGTGHLFPNVYKQTKPYLAFGMDNVFLNLYLAHLYFTKQSTRLLCCDGEKGLPFNEGALDFIIATDSFHYLSKKQDFLKECSRILVRQGDLHIVQTISSEKTVYGNIKGIRPAVLTSMAKRSGFDKIRIVPNRAIVKGRENQKFVRIPNSKIYDKEPYSMSAVKK